MTAYTGTPALPDADLVSGGIIYAADIGAINTAVHGVTDAWTDCSAAVSAGWTASGTALAVGNATVASCYMQANKLVTWQGFIQMGSTTTFGTGNYSVAWPITPAAAVVSSSGITGSAFFYDNSAATARQAGVCVSNGTAGIQFYPGGGTLGIVGQLVPFTWAVSDRLIWCITYQAA